MRTREKYKKQGNKRQEKGNRSLKSLEHNEAYITAFRSRVVWEKGREKKENQLKPH